METFIIPVYQALEENNLGEINEKIGIFKDPSVSNRYITRAFNLYKNISPALKRVQKEDNKHAILDILKSQRLRPEQIEKKFKKYLKELLENEEIIKEREGKAVYYSLNPNPKK